MSRSAIVEILVKLGIDEEAITDDARLFADLQLDSTEAVDVVLELKKRFGVSVNLSSSSDVRIGDLCALLEDGRAAAERETMPD